MLEIPRRNSLVIQTADVLRDGIQRGVWTGNLPGERALANELQVSRPTIRGALSILHKEGLLESSPRGLNRRITGPKKTPVEEEKDCVGVLSAVPLHLMPPASLFYLNELRSSLQNARLRLEVYSEAALSRENPDKVLTRLTSARDVRCWVLAAPSEPVQRWFTESGLPALAAGSCEPGIALPYLDLDYHAICHHAAGVFLRHGHRNLCLFLAQSSAAADHYSEKGFLEAISTFGRKGTEGQVRRHKGNREDICNQLSELLDGPNPPTAILGCRPLHVLTAVTHLSRTGRLPPNGPSFISRDSDTFLRNVTPEISRYTFRRRSYARRLSRLTLQLATNLSLPARPFLVMPDFLEGETAAPL